MKTIPFDVVLEASQTHEDLLVQVKVSDEPSTDHPASSVLLIIDESGSMGSYATTHDDSDGASGLTVLDVVKHAAKTVVTSLGAQDRVGIVAFASQARIVLPLTRMTENGRQNALEAVESLRPRDATNLYDGLIHGLEMVQAAGNPPNANILLLTDGMPNVSPPRGEIETLEGYLDAHDVNCGIGTFGFGYSLKSRLLHDLAVIGRSQYAFIPDSSFVGTVFINAVSNLLSIAVHKPVLKVEAPPRVRIELASQQALPYERASWGVSVVLPPLLYGQTFDVLLRVKNMDGGTVATPPPSIMLETHNGVRTEAQWEVTNACMHIAKARALLMALIYDLPLETKAFDEQAFRTKLQTTADAMQELLALSGGGETIEGIQKDLLGQVSEALSRPDWFARWGVHYLLALARTHVVGWCTNFKDPGPQAYATRKFAALRDVSEQIFISMPPPAPSRTARRSVGSMGGFHNRNAPCFAAGLALMADGTTKDISLLRKGDLMMSPEGVARVLCVVKTLCCDGVEGLVELEGGVLVTPWHPVQPVGASAWLFPCDLEAPSFRACQAVYSFVLEGGSALQIGPYFGIALGHGRNDAPVLNHAYLGTNQVVRDLQACVGWEDGLVVVDELVRDVSTGRIVGVRGATVLS